MNIGVLTSDQWRHKFLANHLAQHLPVKIVVAEPKVADPSEVGRDEEETRVLKAYFRDRLKTEQAILEGGEQFDLPEGVSLVRATPGEINSAEVLEQLLTLDVDTVAVFGTSILKEPLLSPFAGRMINIHLGMSPHYRGVATNFWALYNEDLHLVGATIHHIDPGIDSGDIICQVNAPIVADDTPHTIGNKVIKQAAEAAVEVLKRMEQGPVPSEPQWKPENARLYRRRDFDADVLREFLARWEEGLVARFLKRRAEGQRDGARLITLPDD